MSEEDKQSKAGQKKKWSLKKKVIVISAIVIAIIIVITVTANTATQAPLKVSDQLVNNIQAKNSTAAYSLLSSEAKKIVNQDDFTTVVNQIGPILNSQEKVTSKEISGETGKAAAAKIVYEIKGSDGATYALIVNLTKENDEWKILNFDSSKK